MLVSFEVYYMATTMENVILTPQCCFMSQSTFLPMYLILASIQNYWGLMDESFTVYGFVEIKKHVRRDQ